MTKKKVVVCGGGDSAMDAIMFLKEIEAQIHLVHRRNIFKAMEGKQKLSLDGINIHTPYVPISLLGKNKLEKVIIKNIEKGETKEIESDFLICCYGFTSEKNNFFENLNVNSENMEIETNCFSIGETGFYEKKNNLIVTGFLESHIVFENIKKSLNI